jgi:hypothetical protein
MPLLRLSRHGGHRAGRADHHGLMRAVVHRQVDRRIAQGGEQLGHGRTSRPDRQQHAVRFRGFLLALHFLQRLPQTVEEPLVRFDGAGHGQGSHLAHAVAGREIGRQPQASEQPVQRPVGHEHRQHGVVEPAQLLFRPGPLPGTGPLGQQEQARQRPTQRRVTLPERPRNLREGPADVREHIRVRRALSGEETGYLARRIKRLLEVVDADAVADLPATRVGQPFAGPGQAGLECGD